MSIIDVRLEDGRVLRGVQIAGDQPTPVERQAILRAIKGGKVGLPESRTAPKAPVNGPRMSALTGAERLGMDQRTSAIRRQQDIDQRRERNLGRARAGAQVVGGLGGTVGGAVVGGLPGATFFGAAGVGIADLLFDSAVDAAQAAGLLQGKRKTKAEVLSRAAGDMTLDFMISGAMVGAGPAFGAAKRALLGLKGLQPGELMKASRALEVELGIQDATSSGFMSGVQDVVGRFPFVGTPFKRSGLRKLEQVNRAKSNILSEIAPVEALPRLGVNMHRAATNYFASAKKGIDAEYTKFYDMAVETNARVPTTEGKTAITDILDDIASNRPFVLKEVKEVAKDGSSSVVTKRIPLPPKNSPAVTFLRKLSELEEGQGALQFRTLMKELNQEMDKALARKDKNGFRLLFDAKTAFKRDLENIAGPPEVKQQLLKANKIFARQMRFFSSPTAQRFRRIDKNVFSQGPFEAGIKEADELFTIVFNANSTRDLTKLWKLVGPDNFAKAARSHVDRVFRAAIKETDNGSVLRIDRIRKELGLDDPSSTRFGAFRGMLALGGNKVKPAQVAQFLDVAEAAFKLGIPNVSKFIARRATLGGRKAALGALTFGAVGAGSAISLGAGVGLAANAVTIVMARSFGSFLTNPKALRWATEAIDTNLSARVRTAATIRFIRLFPDIFGDDGTEDLQERVKGRQQGIPQ